MITKIEEKEKKIDILLMFFFITLFFSKTLEKNNYRTQLLATIFTKTIQFFRFYHNSNHNFQNCT